MQGSETLGITLLKTFLQKVRLIHQLVLTVSNPLTRQLLCPSRWESDFLKMRVLSLETIVLSSSCQRVVTYFQLELWVLVLIDKLLPFSTADSQLQGLLGNLDQQQLLQLLSGYGGGLGGHGGLSSAGSSISPPTAASPTWVCFT